MTLLWTRAMPWVQRPDDPTYTPIPVKHAGFAGYVGPHPHDDHPAQNPHEDVADIEDPRLHHFIRNHRRYDSDDLFEPSVADTTTFPIYATQTHVAKEHFDKYRADPRAATHVSSDGSGSADPVLITHEGRVHAADGHHRLAAAIARGDTELPVWHVNLDRLHMPDYDGEDHG